MPTVTRRPTANPGVIYAADYGVTPSLVADAQPAAQDLIDRLEAGEFPGHSVIELPGGTLTLHKPLLISESSITLRGAPNRGTTLRGIFSGHTLVCMWRRPMPLTGASLLTGAGVALKVGGFHSGANTGLLVPTVKQLDLSETAALTISYAIRQDTLTGDAFYNHLTQCGVYGQPAAQSGWNIYTRTTSNRIGVRWGGQDVMSDPGVIVEDTVQFVELTFDGTSVRVWVGVPGGTAAKVIEFASDYATVPVLTKGLLPLMIGSDSTGLAGGPSANDGPDGYVDAVHFSNTVRHTAAFTCPTSKPAADANTLLLLNFVIEDPFVVGDAGVAGIKVYIVPKGPEGTVISDVRVADIIFEPATIGYGGSGPLFQDCQYPSLERLSVQGTWLGYTFYGVTYGGYANQLKGFTEAVGWLQVVQSMAFTIDTCAVSSTGVAVFLDGAVGGWYSNFLVTPQSEPFCSIFVRGGHVRFAGVQIDDEGQAAGAQFGVILYDAVVTFFAGLLVRNSAGPIVTIHGGGAINVFGGWFQNFPGADEIIQFTGTPTRQSVLLGCVYEVTGTPPVSLTPQYVLYDRDMLLNATLA